MRQRITGRPLFAFAVGFLAVLLGGTLLQAALRTLFPTLTTEILAVATMAGRGMVALALVAWFGWREEVGLTPPSRWRNVHLPGCCSPSRSSRCSTACGRTTPPGSPSSRWPRSSSR
jgi:hypothetical protein